MPMKPNKKKGIWILILLLTATILALSFYPSGDYKPVTYIERDTGLLKVEKVEGERWLLWLYDNPVGRATLWSLAKRKVVSSLYRYWMDCTCSAQKIEPFIKDHNIDMDLFEDREFTTFNDFFTRKFKENARIIDTASNILVSPADGKILAYPNIIKADFMVKGYNFDVFTFLNDSSLARKYTNGTLIVIRLSPADYHRFHFPLSGTVSDSRKVKGAYYSVSPYALRKKAEILCLNKREYSLINNPVFGEMVMAEVGATMVGSIIQTYEGKMVQKGEEKGYFQFGGSTIVLLLEKNSVFMDEDILLNSALGYETTVEMGSGIGVAARDMSFNK
ncbi:phosphatidylserine decarboxylase [Lentimicrobium sp.]